MILGILASLVNGACLPLMSLVLGEVSDHLVSGCLVQTNASEYKMFSCTAGDSDALSEAIKHCMHTEAYYIIKYYVYNMNLSPL